MNDRSQRTRIESVLGRHPGDCGAVLPESGLGQPECIVGRWPVLAQGCSTLELSSYAGQAENLSPQNGGIDQEGAALEEGCTWRTIGQRCIRTHEKTLPFPL